MTGFSFGSSDLFVSSDRGRLTVNIGGVNPPSAATVRNSLLVPPVIDNPFANANVFLEPIVNENEMAIGNNSDNVLAGFDGDDTLMGLGGDDRLFGNRDNDFLMGGDGDDTIEAGRDDDRVLGNAGDDVLNGNRGDDIIFGDEGDDRLFGDRGDDTVEGGAGQDTLTGDLGANHLQGGEDADLFVLRTDVALADPDRANLEAADVIVDFSSDDRLGLTDGLTVADLAFSEAAVDGEAAIAVRIGANGPFLAAIVGVEAEEIAGRFISI